MSHLGASVDPREVVNGEPHAANASTGKYWLVRSKRTAAISARGPLYPRLVDGRQRNRTITSAGPCIDSSFRYALLGETDEAYDLGNQCLDQMRPGAVIGGRTISRIWTPELRAFRQDVRFQAFVARLGLMDYYKNYVPPDNCDLNEGKLTCK